MDLHRPRAGEHDDRRRAGPEGAVAQHAGFAEQQSIAARSADQRDIAERVLHGHGEQLLAVREAIDQEQRDLARILAENAGLVPGIGGKMADLTAGVLGVEAVDVRDVQHAEGEAFRGKAHEQQTVGIIAAPGDLARAGASGERDVAEMRSDRGGERVARVGARAEDHPARQCASLDRGGDLGDSPFGARGVRTCNDKTASRRRARCVQWSLPDLP
jgi:hypothetical protein